MPIEIISDSVYYNSIITKTVNKSSISVPGKDSENTVDNTDTYLSGSLNTDKCTYSKPVSSITAASQNDGNEDFNLPSKYDMLKSTYIFYKGKRTSEYDLVKEAIKTGKIELNEGESLGSVLHKATKALIIDKSKPLYKWSSTVYSEDGSYKMRIGKDGEIDGFTYAGSANGNLTKDIAAKVASGEALNNEDIEDCRFLMEFDPELFTAAISIRYVKEGYKLLSGMRDQGILSSEQFNDFCLPVFKFFFGDKIGAQSQNIVGKLKELFNMDSKEFAKYALENYNPI